MELTKMKTLMRQESDIKWLVKQISNINKGKDIEDIIENNDTFLRYLQVFLETRRNKNEI